MYFYYPDIMFQVQFCIMLQKVKTSLEVLDENKIIKSLEGSGISYVLQCRSDVPCIVFQSKAKSDIVCQRSDSLTDVPQIHNS